MYSLATRCLIPGGQNFLSPSRQRQVLATKCGDCPVFMVKNGIRRGYTCLQLMICSRYVGVSIWDSKQ